jgi:hypothetical protein
MEVVVALTLLSVVLLALTGIMWEMGRHTYIASAVGARGAAIEGALGLGEGTRWDSLSALVGCTTDTSGQLVYTRCVEYLTPNPTVRQLRMILTPTDGSLRPETLLVTRVRPRSRSPLYAP